jgi:D-arabinose 1-dehydrogenase-like Zn-dependent alcohol dehydrogenase
MISYDIIEHGMPLQRVARETPRPKGSEVLVRITHSGVCHSDLHIWNGFFDWGNGKRFYVRERGCVPPFTLGHEPFGVIEAVGPSVRGVRPGQKRLVYPWIGCGLCAVCKAGQDNYCVSGARFLGIFRNGAYATHVLVPHPRYLLDAGRLDPGFAATLACSALTVFSAAAKLPPIGRKDWVAVLGCGGLGLAAFSILRARGVKNVVACDIDGKKLDAALRLGASRALNCAEPEGAIRLRELTENNLVGALDFVGTEATAALALDTLRKGGHYVLCGLHGGELRQPLPLIAQRAITIAGSYVGTLDELQRVVALARKGKITPLPLQKRRAREVNRTIEDLESGRIIGRVVLDFSQEQD